MRFVKIIFFCQTVRSVLSNYCQSFNFGSTSSYCRFKPIESTTMSKPELVVFDLDYTLWPFWIDTHHDPPFSWKGKKIIDRYGRHVEYYDEVPQMLNKLKEENYKLAIASRTSEGEAANELLRLLEWKSYFSETQIYTGSKTHHFQNFHSCTGIPYSKMLFFDDEHRNIRDVSALGVTAILVNNGMSMDVLEKGLSQYRAKSK